MFDVQALEQSGAAFAKGFFDTSATMLNDLNISNSITQVVQQILRQLAANTTNNSEFQQQLADNFANFSKIFIKNISADLGPGMATGLNDFINHVTENLYMKTAAANLANRLTEAFKEGITTADFAGTMAHLTSEWNVGADVLRESYVRNLQLFLNDTQSSWTDLARNTTLQTVPWIVLGGAISLGVPLLVSCGVTYAYRSITYNIGRPRLAQEIRRVDIWGRFTNGIRSGISNLWKATKQGAKWGVMVGVVGGSLGCVEAACTRFMEIEDQPSYIGSLLPLAMLSASLVGSGINLADNIYRSFFKRKKDHQPIFDVGTQTRIDDLTKATYNIKQHGGYMQNLLLYGPGGTGKTMISKYIATHSGMNYVMMSGGDLAQYIKRGEHITELNHLFEHANNSSSPTILFIDECESLCGDRGKMDRSELIELVNGFLNHSGEPNQKVMIILTTNRKDELDPAILSRMDHKIYIGPPKKAERKKILQLYLRDFMTQEECEKFFSEQTIDNIAERIEGFTGRTIFKMLNTISGQRAATRDDHLTQKIIEKIINDFIKQEEDILKKLE